MKNSLLILFGLIAFNVTILGQETDKSFTIYLVRHSEKVIDMNNLKDPPLTVCGVLRSESMARFFSEIDLERVYSSDFERTRETARPTANAKKLDMEIYDSRKLQDLADLIVSRKEDVLIVGHSNTTPLLAGELSGEDTFAIPENVYNTIYQVIIGENERILNIFYTSFECEPEDN